MATPKDKLSKVLEQRSDTSDTKAPWQEALDRHVTIPATRSVEAAEVFKGFAGSWAASYSLDSSVVSTTEGPQGVPAIQKKVSHLGQAGMHEINFRPYDWGTHRFGPKGPSLLGHPISFEVVGPTLKSNMCDWQWQLIDKSGVEGEGDVLTIDTFDEAGALKDVPVFAPKFHVGPIPTTSVAALVGPNTTFEDYYGFSDLSDFVHSGLYIVVSSGGGGRDLDSAGGPVPGGIGDGTIGLAGQGGRSGSNAKTEGSYTEIFRVVGLNNQTKSITLDPIKSISKFFDLNGDLPIIRAITFIRPVATRLVSVPGSDGKVFAVVPPEKALLDDTTPPYAAWKLSQGGWNPWGSSLGGFHIQGNNEDYFYFKPVLPIETPREHTTLVQGGAFNGLNPAVTFNNPNIGLWAHEGYKPQGNEAYERLIRINEVELVGKAASFDSTGLYSTAYPKDPGINWWLGYHEINKCSDGNGLLVVSRLPEYNPHTGVTFYPQPFMDQPQYDTTDPNDGIRFKATLHDAVRTLWTDPHPRMEKISAARLTNLIDPSWVSESQSLKVGIGSSASDPYPKVRPDKAIFDTSTSNAGASGSNADPGNLMDLGFRMVLFPAKDGGAGHLVPDFDNPIDSREVDLYGQQSGESGWVDIDYSAGLVTLSDTPGQRGVFPRIPQQKLTALAGGFDFDQDPANTYALIRRNDGGSFILDGYKVKQLVQVEDPSNPALEGTYRIIRVSADELGFKLASAPIDSYPANWAAGFSMANTTAVLISGDNPRGEVVIFASCVPYSRERSQYGAGVRVTGGQVRTGEDCIGTYDNEILADVFGHRRFWRLAGSNATPQTVDSSLVMAKGADIFSIELDGTINPADMPSQGYIEIIKGNTPNGEAALTSGSSVDKESTAIFGYLRVGFTDQRLYVWGGGENGAASFVVDDDNPYVAVLRRDIALPQWSDGSVGTDYRHDVTYGFANRSDTLRFKNASIKKMVDGSTYIENTEGLAETHQDLFEDILSSWVLSGFPLTPTAPASLTVEVGAGALVIDGVRSEMAATSITLPAVDGHYYIYVKPHNGEPACPVVDYQLGLPLAESNHVLIGRAFVRTGVVVELANLQAPMQDINLRDEILVGNPRLGQNNYPYNAQPHFSTLKDAVDYACELLKPKQTTGGNPLGDRFLRIKVIGPTIERDTITFTASGISIEGLGYDQMQGILSSGSGASHGIRWNAQRPLFDLNGQSNLSFKNLLLEFTGDAKGGFTPVIGEGLQRVAFANTSPLGVIGLTLDNIELRPALVIDPNEYANIPQALVYFDLGLLFVDIRIKNCRTFTSDTAVYIGGNDFRDTTVLVAHDMVIEDNWFTGTWDPQYNNVANYRDVTNSFTVHLKGTRGDASFPTVNDKPEPFGGIVLAGVVQQHIQVHRNQIQNFAGYGIFGTTLVHSSISKNFIVACGDFGISLGCPWAYEATGSMVVDTTVRDNSVKLVSSLDLTATAVDGRRFQYDMGVGTTNHPGNPTGSKKVIYLEGQRGSSFNMSNLITGNTGTIDVRSSVSERDALVSFYQIKGSVISENRAEYLPVNQEFVGGGGIHLEWDCDSVTVANNFCGHSVLLTDTDTTSRLIIRDNFFSTAAVFATESLIQGNMFRNQFPVTVGRDCIFDSNFSMQASSDQTLSTFESGCSITNNISVGNAVGFIGIQTDTLVSGNRLFHAVDLDLPTAGSGADSVERLVITNNDLVSIGMRPLDQDVYVNDSVISNNVVQTEIALSDTLHVANFMHSTITGNRCAGIAMANSDMELGVISSNTCLELKGAGNGNIEVGMVQRSVIADNTLRYFSQEANLGVMVLGRWDETSVRQPCEQVAVVGNVVCGKDDRVDYSISGAAGYVNFGGASSGAIQFDGGSGFTPSTQDLAVSLRANIANSLITGNVFVNGVLVSGFDPNANLPGGISQTERVLVTNNFLGDNESPANVRGNPSSVIVGDKMMFSNNVSRGDDDDTQFNAYQFVGAMNSVSDNHLEGRVLSQGSNFLFDGNTLHDSLHSGLNCGVFSKGNYCQIQGNRIASGDDQLSSILSVGYSPVVTSNHVQGQGNLDVAGIHAVITNNRVYGNLRLFNPQSGTGPGTDEKTDRYLVSNNMLSPKAGDGIGDIFVPDFTSDAFGTLIGNTSKNIRTLSDENYQNSSAVNHMIVLGNRVNDTGTIFGARVGPESVGWVGPGLLEVFNVTE